MGIVDLKTVIAAVKSLRSFTESKRECFDVYEQQGAEKSNTAEYMQLCNRRRNVRLMALDRIIPGKIPEAQTESPPQPPAQKFYIHFTYFLPATSLLAHWTSGNT